MPDHRAPAVIRPARTADVAAVQAVVGEAFSPYIERIGVEPMPMRLDYRALVEAGQVWVAIWADRVCGVLVLEPHTDHLLLDVIAVADEARGQGVGAALMEFAEQRARLGGVPEVRLYTNVAMTENLEYYPRRGYTEIGRETVAEVFHRVFFSKRID